MKLRELLNRKTKVIPFLLLITTFVLIFLFNEKKFYSVLLPPDFASRSPPEPTSRSPPEPTSRSPPEPTSRSPPEPTSRARVQSCSYKHVSAEHAAEAHSLLASIAWPETPPLPKGFPLRSTTSASLSSFSVEPRGGAWHMGEELTVRIQLRDFNGKDKTGGGDFLVSRLHNRALGAGVVGRVHDHLNGTFTAVFPLLWSGTADVEVMLVQSSEAISFLKRLTEQQPDRIFFKSDFRSGHVTQGSVCNVCLDPGHAPLCNFTDLHTGEPWFCYKPKTLDCSTRVSHSKGGFNRKISKEEAQLFQKDINMKSYIHAEGNKTVTVLPNEGEALKLTHQPAGYYHMDHWRPLGGSRVESFTSASDVTACLRGKQLHLFGDSTIRQFYEHITKTVPNLLTFDQHSSQQSGPLMALDHTNDITVTYRCHGPPIRYGYIPSSQLHYVANELDTLTGGADTVVVIGVWSHFSTFPLEVYYRRLANIRKAVQRLKDRAPETTVVVRSANMKALTLNESLTNSDWFSFQQDRLLRAVFNQSDVLLLDAWEMGLAHYLPHKLHPQPEILKVLVDVVLSNACPEEINSYWPDTEQGTVRDNYFRHELFFY